MKKENEKLRERSNIADRRLNLRRGTDLASAFCCPAVYRYLSTFHALGRSLRSHGYIAAGQGIRTRPLVVMRGGLSILGADIWQTSARLLVVTPFPPLASAFCCPPVYRYLSNFPRLSREARGVTAHRGGTGNPDTVFGRGAWRDGRSWALRLADVSRLLVVTPFPHLVVTPFPHPAPPFFRIDEPELIG
jgi:hypothetical protein